MESQTAALLIDWENIKYSTVKQLNSTPDIIILKKIARKYGQLKIAKAYANWADMQHEGDMERFSYQNVEPVFVQTRRFMGNGIKTQTVKGAADIRLACDCMELLIQNPHLHTFILATGDAGFEHVINKINAHGKRAVIIAVRKSAGQRLGVVSDEVVWYDDWTAGLKIAEVSREVEDALMEFKRAVEDTRRNKENNDLQSIKLAMRKRIPAFEEEDIGLPTFRHLAHLAELNRLVRIDCAVTPAKAYLNDEGDSDEGQPIHTGIKWKKLIKALEPNTPYNFGSIKKIIMDRSIYKEQKDIQEFMLSAAQSGVLWFKPIRFHNQTTGEVQEGRNYYLDPNHPKVQVYRNIKDSEDTAHSK